MVVTWAAIGSLAVLVSSPSAAVGGCESAFGRTRRVCVRPGNLYLLSGKAGWKHSVIHSNAASRKKVYCYVSRFCFSRLIGWGGYFVLAHVERETIQKLTFLLA